MKNKKIYDIWKRIIDRCCDEKYQEKYPTYKDVTVCAEWYDFHNFSKWYESNYIETFHLDKDVLCRNCKIYSPETCCFVPREINNLFTNRYNKRGIYPLGVSKLNNLFKSNISINGLRVHLGLFKTPQEAFEVYKIAKENYIKEKANEWKGKITEEVYNAMYVYEVDIKD